MESYLRSSNVILMSIFCDSKGVCDIVPFPFDSQSLMKPVWQKNVIFIRHYDGFMVMVRYLLAYLCIYLSS